MGNQVWQIACGEKGRRYQRLFLDHDVMFLGPGRFGPYSLSLYDANPEARAEGEGKSEDAVKILIALTPAHFAR